MTGVATYFPIFLPSMTEEEFGRLILRDGTSARLRVIRPDDAQRFQEFFQNIPPPGIAPPERLAQLFNPHEGITLIVLGGAGNQDRILATASFLRRDAKEAALSFAVGDDFRDKGLGSLLLERLALIAASAGIESFTAVTKAENKAMLGVFRDSGFPIRERTADGISEIKLVVKPNGESQTQSGMRERIATVASLRPFFKPHSVAVVGASRTPGRLGHQVLQALLRDGFQGEVYPINPHAETILSVPAFPNLREVPGDIDLAVIVVPSADVLSVVDDAAAKNVPALVVITAGFSETGPAGKALQDRLLENVRGYGMRMVGPNCMGIINTAPQVRLNASFSTAFPPSGWVAMSSQSGALGLAIVDLAARLGIGLTQFISVGNKADVSNNDLLQYWEEDAETRVILLYLESFGNPRKFSRIARRVARRKPVVVVKGGRSEAGQRAAGSHTAALASSETAVEALFKQTGLIRADTLKDMFDLAKLLTHQPLPEGARVAIVTNSGGPGILCADACAAAGLKVLPISSELQAKLHSFFPAEASVKNPIDMVASAAAENYRKAIEVLLTASEVDAVVAIYIPVGEDQTGEVGQAVLAGRKAALGQGVRKPLLMNFLAGNAETHLKDESQTIPVFSYPEEAARALGKVLSYAQWLARTPGQVPDFDDLDLARARRIIKTAQAERGSGWLSASETQEVLKSFGIHMPPGGIAKTPDEAVALAKETGYPLAAKLSSTKITHKTEMGGVILNVNSEAELREAFHRIEQGVKKTEFPDAMDGVLIQPMVKKGVEVIAGLSLDPAFGPLIGFGLGGIFVEILRDMQFRVAPLSDLEAREMIEGIRGFPLLQGYRGHPAGDVAALQELLLRFSALAELLPEIKEGDLNPVFALAPGEGYALVDARLRIG